MFVHTFVLKLKPDTDEAQLAQAVTAIRALQGQIPELRSTAVGKNISPRAQGFTLGGAMHFDDEAAFERYNTHPAHLAILGLLGPLMVEAVEVDFDPEA